MQNDLMDISTEVLANDADVFMERKRITVVVFRDLLQKPVCEPEKVDLRFWVRGSAFGFDKLLFD